MSEQVYLNKQVSEIVGITQRQVLSWTEKGLVVPFSESMGTGTKRGYDYQNLLEFGLCEELFKRGHGFRLVKRVMIHLKTKKIEDWRGFLFCFFDTEGVMIRFVIPYEKGVTNWTKVKEEFSRFVVESMSGVFVNLGWIKARIEANIKRRIDAKA